MCAAVLGVFPDGDATEEAAEFKAAAQAMREDFEFGLVTDAALVPEAKGCAYVKTLLRCCHDSTARVAVLWPGTVLAGCSTPASDSFAYRGQGPLQSATCSSVESPF